MRYSVGLTQLNAAITESPLDGEGQSGISHPPKLAGRHNFIANCATPKQEQIP